MGAHPRTCAAGHLASLLVSGHFPLLDEEPLDGSRCHPSSVQMSVPTQDRKDTSISLAVALLSLGSFIPFLDRSLTTANVADTL